MTYALGDEYTDQQAGNEEDNDEDNNDTGLTLSPVLVALGQLGDGVLAASGNEVGDGGHCVGCVGFYSNVSQTCPADDDEQLGVATASNWKVEAQAQIGRVSFRDWERVPRPMRAHTAQNAAFKLARDRETARTHANRSSSKRYRAYL